MGDSCCGSAVQEIVLSATDAGVVLRRCSRCGERQYTYGGEAVEPDKAFQALAGTFRRDGRSAQAPGADAAQVPAPRTAAARAAERAAERAALRAQQAAARAAEVQAAAQPPATVDVTDLADLLTGWTVLGVTR